VLAFDPYISESAAKEFSVELVVLEKLLEESDFISLHTAVSPLTQNMINAQSIGMMKKGVRIVNAARGELIHEADLAAALKSGHVAGAALDVFAEEPPKNSPLVGLPNVICTPHVAGSTAEAQEELGNQVAVQVRDYLMEGVIRNAVNLPALSPEHAALFGAGGAAGIAGVASGGNAACAGEDPVCRRAGGSGNASFAQRGACRPAERSVG
jgi:D-3-phosphoglycerate dehydrogenase / 2-oxoglutarate reductase